jgi:hypothetical protein
MTDLMTREKPMAGTDNQGLQASLKTTTEVSDRIRARRRRAMADLDTNVLMNVVVDAMDAVCRRHEDEYLAEVRNRI